MICVYIYIYVEYAWHTHMLLIINQRIYDINQSCALNAYTCMCIIYIYIYIYMCVYVCGIYGIRMIWVQYGMM